MNTARGAFAGAGTQTSALGFGGYSTASPSGTGATEAYNGTSWTADTSMGTARYGVGGAGTQSAALAFGGRTTPEVASTEEWTGAGAAVTKTITVS